MAFLAAEGYQQYEISNWARGNSEFQCRHNLQYWRNLDYLGFGAGAHGYAGGVRYSNVLRIKTYLERLSPPLTSGNWPLSPAVVHAHQNSLRENLQEAMLTGLRLTEEGVAAGVFQQRFGVELTTAFGAEIAELVKFGLLAWAEPLPGERILRLTERGRLLGNQVFLRFVGD